MNRKQLAEQYKERTVVGGVFRIRNTQSGRMLLAAATDLDAARNRFDFAVATNSCVFHDLVDDWRIHGPGAFVFDELERLTRGSDQSPASFAADCKALEELWREKLAQQGLPA